ncbi:zinc finger protein 27-like [Bacillus rossius redtenbacheri]|uniref:zinc finger protein 27-like n=1 Tax=Bacillus rossius redtenbacheri TaxID=93214 RepID=UPI002FDD26A8
MAHSDGLMTLNLKWEVEEEETICGVDSNCVIFPDNVNGLPMAGGMAAVQADGAGQPFHFSDQDVMGIQVIEEEVVCDAWDSGQIVADVVSEEIVGDTQADCKDEKVDVEIPLPQDQDAYTVMRPYPCDFCSRRFRKKANLMNHMVSHQTDKPHGCNLCGVRYRRKCDLINHMKIHAFPPAHAGYGDEADRARGAARGRRKKIQSLAPSRKKAALTYNNHGGRDPERDDDHPHGKGLSESSRTVEFYDMEVKFFPEHVEPGPADPGPPRWPVVDETRPYVCQHCGVGFAREKALASHSRVHAGDSPFECNTCGEMFWDVALLREHARNKHGNRCSTDTVLGNSDERPEEFRCDECGLSFERQELLKRHHHRCHVKMEPGTEHVCEECGEAFAGPSELLAHSESHSRYRPHRCMLCGECFDDAAGVSAHIRRRHGRAMPSNTCALCGKTCKDRRSLQKHSWVHSAERSFQCVQCGKRFHSRARLKRHMTSHRDKAVSCEVCGEEFPDGRALINHRHSHNKDLAARQFSCLECGKTFGSRSSQQIHARIHTGERPYGCRYCWKAFADGGTLRKHERIHTGEKPYACVICPRAFNQRVVLREHIRSHHSGPDVSSGHLAVYSCKVCAVSFGRSEELCAHLIHHSDENTAKHRAPSLGPRKYKRRRRYGHDAPRFPSVASFAPAAADEKPSDTESDAEVRRKITKKRLKPRARDHAGENLRTVAKTLDLVVDNISSLVHKSSVAKSKREKMLRKKYKTVGYNKPPGVDPRASDGKAHAPNYNAGGFVRRTKPAAEGRARPRTKNVTSSTLAALKAVSAKPGPDRNAKSAEMNRVRPRTKNVNYHNVQLGKLTPAVFPNNLKTKAGKKGEGTAVAARDESAGPAEKSSKAKVSQAAKSVCGVEDELNGNFRCEMCSETFSRRSELLVHVSIHI